MEMLKRWWMQIRLQLENLKATEKWLIGMSLAVLLLVGVMLVNWAGQAERVPVSQFAQGQTTEVVARLQQAGINVTTEGPQVLVPVEQQIDAIAILQQSDLMREDTSMALNEWVKNMSPWRSNKQSDQALQLATQKYLGMVISKMRGVESADVILASAQQKRFGQVYVPPSAAVSVAMQGRKNVGRELVESIAGFVSGAVAELSPQDVKIIDASHGRQYTVKDPNEMMPDERLAYIRQLEEDRRQKILETLRYIPGVIVAVNIVTDTLHSKKVRVFDYQDKDQIASQRDKEMERVDVQDAGNPGVRPNTGLDIEGGSRNTTRETMTESEVDFGQKQLTRDAVETYSGNQISLISVTVNVPRNYFQSIYMRGKDPENQAPPDDAALQPIVQQQLAQIEEQVEALVQNPGQSSVKASMFYDTGDLFPGLGAPDEPTGVMGMLASQWNKHLVLGLLGAASLGLMFWMVRRATQQPHVPSAEELAGIPPTLPSDDDLVGEVEESDATLAGVEIEEGELQQRKIAEQISEMVRANPAEAAKLLKRWVKTED